MSFETYTPTQIIAINEVYALASQNGWHDAQLFNYAKDFLISIDEWQAFYSYMLNMKSPFAQIWADTFHHIREFIANNSLMPDFYDYLKTLPTADPP